jgi:orotate phosphoribosyltransferase
MDRTELIERIAAVALLRGTFTLRSGRVSSYYLDKYLFETQPDILAALAHCFAEHIDAAVDRLAGAELGGIPLVTAASMATGKPSVLIRNQKKDYGTAKQIEGVLHAGERVLIVEDVVTSGGQVLEGAQVLRDAGAEVVKVVSVIDRQEGGRAKIEAAGLQYESLFTKTDLGISE